LLVQRGGGHSVAGEGDFVRRVRTWTSDEGARREAGDYARALVRAGIGAADRSFEIVNRLLR
jgi:hypothetical protein